jgi:transcriptional regulator with XRE-family HTH domain
VFVQSALGFAKIIRTLVARDGVSVNKALLACGLGKSLIVDMERTGGYPSADKLSRLADYFNVSTDYLLGRTDDPAVNRKADDL